MGTIKLILKIAWIVLMTIPEVISFVIISFFTLIHLGITKLKYGKRYRDVIEGYKKNL